MSVRNVISVLSSRSVTKLCPVICQMVPARSKHFNGQGSHFNAEPPVPTADHYLSSVEISESSKYRSNSQVAMDTILDRVEHQVQAATVLSNASGNPAHYPSSAASQESLTAKGDFDASSFYDESKYEGSECLMQCNVPNPYPQNTEYAALHTAHYSSLSLPGAEHGNRDRHLATEALTYHPSMYMTATKD